MLKIRFLKMVFGEMSCKFGRFMGIAEVKILD
jgi:hypothetical protein